MIGGGVESRCNGPYRIMSSRGAIHLPTERGIRVSCNRGGKLILAESLNGQRIRREIHTEVVVERHVRGGIFCGIHSCRGRNRYGLRRVAESAGRRVEPLGVYCS